jgi:hypothetical protein
MTPNNLLVQQLMDLQNRITEQAATERLELTPGEIVLLSYALGGFTGYLLLELEALKPPRAPRRVAKKAKARR